ncbi:MAG: hypothetical protein QGG69_03885, partial [Kiritimatiellia bacterium]|nr:hypothetical protein [Kiritimatiellia bacterium]
MHKVSVVVLALIASVMLVSPVMAQGHRAGAGINVMSPLGDMDDGVGGYVSYMFDISDMLATYVGLSHISGDYDLVVDGVQYRGGYSGTSAEAAFLVQWHMDTISPYAGIGGGWTSL